MERRNPSDNGGVVVSLRLLLRCWANDRATWSEQGSWSLLHCVSGYTNMIVREIVSKCRRRPMSEDQTCGIEGCTESILCEFRYRSPSHNSTSNIMVPDRPFPS